MNGNGEHMKAARQVGGWGGHQTNININIIEYFLIKIPMKIPEKAVKNMLNRISCKY
jgi:hypothetical protein